LTPEPADEPAQEQVLGKAHARVRRHLEGAHFDQAESAAAVLRGEELVDAELGAMAVAGSIAEQVPKQAVAQPRRRVAEAADVSVQFLEGDFQFVERIMAGFVDARRLRRGPDEEAAEKPAQGWMILPVSQQRAEEIRPPQHR